MTTHSKSHQDRGRRSQIACLQITYFLFRFTLIICAWGIVGWLCKGPNKWNKTLSLETTPRNRTGARVERLPKRATKWTDSLTALMVFGLKYGSNDEAFEGRSKYTIWSANDNPHCKNDIKKTNCAFISIMLNWLRAKFKWTRQLNISF